MRLHKLSELPVHLKVRISGKVYKAYHVCVRPGNIGPAAIRHKEGVPVVYAAVPGNIGYKWGRRYEYQPKPQAQQREYPLRPLGRLSPQQPKAAANGPCQQKEAYMIP